jgi:hypothetical protein
MTQRDLDLAARGNPGVEERIEQALPWRRAGEDYADAYIRHAKAFLQFSEQVSAETMLLSVESAIDNLNNARRHLLKEIQS